MDVFLLGAGRPAWGKKPSALKHVALNTRAMDWQIHSFESVAEPEAIHFLGGYHVEEVIESYPQLNFTVIPDWQRRSVLYTLLKAPFAERPVIVSYSDTVFRNSVIRELVAVDADVVVAIDTQWRQRFDQRPQDDIDVAETIQVEETQGSRRVEFTGLVYLSERVTRFLLGLDDAKIGVTLVDLVEYLSTAGFSISYLDVAGEWAEFNSPRDIAQFILGTKAETLARLEPLVTKSHIGKQVSFTCSDWQSVPADILEQIDRLFSGEPLVVRSSSTGEDGWQISNAGGFESLLNIDSRKRGDLVNAIDRVIDSYGSGHHDSDQVLVQACLQQVKMAGVIFTCGLETGSPYYRINFDDKSQSTESVTAGTHDDLRTVIVSRLDSQKLGGVAPELLPVLDAIIELEQLLGFDRLDIEFAVDTDDRVHIFQVRPVTVDHSEYEADLSAVADGLRHAVSHFSAAQSSPPFSCGDYTLFANMPDWNPAEIIGTHPRPLAFSLYRELITDDVWARQRAEYGYCDVRPYPLIASFAGHPYVDVRASLNSFIPSQLPAESRARIASAYLGLLADNPHRHDKIEFEVAFTVWTPDFSEMAWQRLLGYGVTEHDIVLLEQALKGITRRALTRLKDDIQQLAQLAPRRDRIVASALPAVSKALALLDDCKRFGTLAFSHAARAGFVATTWLKSLVAEGVISDERRLTFLSSFNTVASDLERDKLAVTNGEMSADALVANYGHLRPGTYEITVQAYWEDPQHYLLSESIAATEDQSPFSFSTTELAAMRSILIMLGSSLSSRQLVTYLQRAIQEREAVKFEFTRNLSKALDYIVEMGLSLGLSREALAYLEYADLQQVGGNIISADELQERIRSRREYYSVTRLIELPPLIAGEDDFYCFERLASQPNFVTVRRVVAPVQQLDDALAPELTDKLVMIPQADPGYDWLFGHGIAGLITLYGGANSHMAIRAAEIGLPAAIGVGEKLYEQIAMMKRVELDCGGHTIREVQ